MDVPHCGNVCQPGYSAVHVVSVFFPDAPMMGREERLAECAEYAESTELSGRLQEELTSTEAVAPGSANHPGSSGHDRQALCILGCFRLLQSSKEDQPTRVGLRAR